MSNPGRLYDCSRSAVPSFSPSQGPRIEKLLLSGHIAPLPETDFLLLASILVEYHNDYAEGYEVEIYESMASRSVENFVSGRFSIPSEVR